MNGSFQRGAYADDMGRIGADGKEVDGMAKRNVLERRQKKPASAGKSGHQCKMTVTGHPYVVFC